MHVPNGPEEIPVEQFEVPEFIPRDEIRMIRREAKIDRDLAFTRLEFISRSLGIYEGPRFFANEVETNTDYERYRILTVPLKGPSYRMDTIFVAVNITTTDPELSGDQYRRATAFKFDIRERQIAQYPEHTATLRRGAKYWRQGKKYGPHLRVEEGFVHIRYWDATRLKLPEDTYDKISLQSVHQREMAAYLASVLGRLRETDEQNCSLFPSEL